MMANNLDLPPIARHMLHTLLDRLEQPDRQTVVRVRLSETAYPDYFAPDDAGPRHATHSALQHLANQGILRLRWRKWEQGNWLTAVDLLPEQADQLYLLLGRSPRQDHVAHLRGLLAQQVAVAGWHAAFLAWAVAQLDAYRSVLPLNLEDPIWNQDLLCALDALAHLSVPIMERTLSVRLFADSKRLAELRGAIVRVLRSHDPQAASYGDDAWALLNAHLLERIPEYVPVAGSLVLRDSSLPADTVAHLDLTGLPAGLALPASMLRTVRVVECAAQRIITVENATSFHELLARRPSTVLVVYIGGFASPSVLTFLRVIRQHDPAIPFYHWGDLDPDGLRILAHLRMHLSDVLPLAMDVATFERYQRHARPLTAHDRTTLEHLRTLELLADCRPLIEHISATGQKLEQEAVEGIFAESP